MTQEFRSCFSYCLFVKIPLNDFQENKMLKRIVSLPCALVFLGAASSAVAKKPICLVDVHAAQEKMFRTALYSLKGKSANEADKLLGKADTAKRDSANPNAWNLEWAYLAPAQVKYRGETHSSYFFCAIKMSISTGGLISSVRIHGDSKSCFIFSNAIVRQDKGAFRKALRELAQEQADKGKCQLPD